jgi:hypothetical protein
VVAGVTALRFEDPAERYLRELDHAASIDTVEARPPRPATPPPPARAPPSGLAPVIVAAAIAAAAIVALIFLLV